jgi:hypothetical protein
MAATEACFFLLLLLTAAICSVHCIRPARGCFGDWATPKRLQRDTFFPAHLGGLGTCHLFDKPTPELG